MPLFHCICPFLSSPTSHHSPFVLKHNGRSKFQRKMWTIFGGHSFGYSAPTVRNSVPADLRASPSLSKLSSQIKNSSPLSSFLYMITVACLLTNVCIYINMYICFLVRSLTQWVSCGEYRRGGGGVRLLQIVTFYVMFVF